MKIKKYTILYTVSAYLFDVFILTFFFILFASILGYFFGMSNYESLMQIIAGNLGISKFSKGFLFFLVVMIPVFIVILKKRRPISGIVIISFLLFTISFLFFIMGSIYGINWKAILSISILVGVTPILFYLIISAENRLLKCRKNNK